MSGLAAAATAIGTAVSAFGALQQGRMAAAAARQQSAEIEVQKVEAAQLSSIQEWRSRQKMRAEMRQQQAQIGARGFDQASPTALYLGQTAAAEIAFEGQAIRQGASSQQRELTANQAALDLRARNAMLTSRYKAAGTVLKSAPDLWPELLA